MTPNQRRAFWEDKIRGMRAVAAYGDALGAPHELQGLSGHLGSQTPSCALQPLAAYYSMTTLGSPWNIWFDGSDLAPDLKGVPTDDTAYRLCVLEPWLCSHGKLGDLSLFTESDLQEWVEEVLSGSPSPLGWQRCRHAQMRAWLAAWADARHWTQAGADPTHYGPYRHQNQHFRVGFEVAFGLFLYLELAALWAQRPLAELLPHFMELCSLDLGAARVATAIAGSLVAGALRRDPLGGSDGCADFGEWFFNHLTCLKLYEKLDPLFPRVLAEIGTAGQLGGALYHRKASDQEFLQCALQALYLPHVKKEDPWGLRCYNPVLFLKLIACVLGFSRRDTPRAFALLAFGPGDNDTMCHHLGLMVGAYYGFYEIAHRFPEFGGECALAEATADGLFHVDTQGRVDHLAWLLE